ncbi:SGNH/GDSL hydrolase family protein [Deinococcus radiomollis]|uniref:SGNH/GDSL hydrolase family protein n=1 Tax=Deinococcus radiomollis TaxID=468916 RepID=UPI0038922BAF
MKRSSTRIKVLSFVGLSALLLATVTQARTGERSTLTPQEAAICGAATGRATQVTAFRKLSAGAHLRVVVIGSSSTAGAGASQPSLNYVSQFARQLQTEWSARVEVFNRGVGGDTLRDIVGRAPRDVLALNPDVVVVQTGTNDVLQNVAVADYARRLQSFVHDLQQKNIRVVLIDNQYLPDRVHSEEYLAIQGATHDVARLNHAPLVSRFALSEQIQAQLHLTPQELLAADGLHPNDVMHACTARALTATLINALGTASGV